MRVVITGPFDPRVRQQLQDQGHEVTVLPANVGAQELAARLEWAEAYLLGGFEYVTGPMLERAPGLRLLVFMGVQPETFLSPEAQELLEARHAELRLTGGDASQAVAEMALALALAALRHLVPLATQVAERKWPVITGRELAGKTVGILGMGRIGRRLVGLLAGFGCQILYYDTQRWELDRDHQAHLASMDEVLAQSDLVSLHTPLTDHTRGMIGERELRLMKPTAVLVNAARPQLVDPGALRRSLEQGHPAAAAFDGYYLEGQQLERSMDDPYGLLAMSDRFLCTSHQGYNTAEALAAASERAAELVAAHAQAIPAR